MRLSIRYRRRRGRGSSRRSAGCWRRGKKAASPGKWVSQPGESLEELRWLAIEDQHMAEAGLVELRRSEEAWYKHIYDLVREDRPARIEAESARTAWLMERLRKSKATGSDGRGEI
jgi:hypothetical protein